MNRPAPTMVNGFEAVIVSSGLINGEFKWGVRSGIGIVHDGLLKSEAEMLAWVLNRQISGFRATVKLETAGPEQLHLFLSPIALAKKTAEARKIMRAQRHVGEMKKVKAA